MLRFFPKHNSIPTEFKNSAATFDQSYILSRCLFDFCRHTVSFRKEVSNTAVFNFNSHA